MSDTNRETTDDQVAEATTDPAQDAPAASPAAAPDASPAASAAPAASPKPDRVPPGVYRRRRAVVGLGALVVVAGATAAVLALVNGLGAQSAPLTVVQPAAAATPTPLPALEPTPEPTSTPTPESTPEPEPTPEPAARFDTTSASSLTVLVNKRNPLDPIDYQPADLVPMSDVGVPSLNGHSLRREAAEAAAELYQAAAAEGIHLDMTSGYRDYDLQSTIYHREVDQMGVEAADLLTARPGHSEHQTGLAADFSAPGESGCIIETCFANTNAARWLAEHSWKYGFILRFPEGYESVTGIAYEPWHFRFIGVEAAAAYHESGAATYEEFLGAPSAPDYG